MAFIECGGNSAPLFSKEPIQANVQALHGLVSCAEWTGVRLSTLLEESGIDTKAKWIIAEGADASHLSRSVPLTKALDDAMIALYQNGERLMPGNGYPMRLLLPGWEGNMNIKWLRRIQLTELPNMSYYESKIYAPILPGGKAYQFYFIQEVKSFITHPSPGLAMKGSGVLRNLRNRLFRQRSYFKSDGIRRWRPKLDTGGTAGAGSQQSIHAIPRTVAMGGRSTVLQSRAWDEAGFAQPTRADFVATRGEMTGVPAVTAFPNEHYNAIVSWSIDRSGEVKHVYA